MKNTTVSIIIPVRNAEKYIERCVKSIQAQTHQDLDIILVLNDSSDQSEAICKYLASTDSRINILDIKEAGVSRARNAGIEIALGRYVIFVDADDFVHTDLVGRMYASANDHNVKIVAPSFEKRIIDRLGTEHHNRSRNHNIRSYDYIQRMLLGNHEYDGYVWGKMYSSSILSDIRFDETLTFSEDTDFLLKLLRQDLQIFISPFVGYFYSQDTSGITKDTSGNQRLKSLALSETFIEEAVDGRIRTAAQCYSWRNAYYILSQSNVSSSDQNRVWDVMKKHRTAVITNTLSPVKYRLIASLSLLGKGVFMSIISRLVRGKKNA